MRFIDWLYSSYPNPSVPGQYKLGHILTMVLVAGIIITASLLLRKKSEKARKIFLWVIVGFIMFFEISRRAINLCKTTDYSIHNLLHTLLPRPGCAISCWMAITALAVNKKFYYNITCFLGIICALIFFAYPGVGFNNEYILYENLYSIATHSLLMIVCCCFITLKMADFKYKPIWKDIVCFAVVLAYVFLEMFVFKIESDPLYFMPGNDIQDILGVSYPVFLPLYLGFILLYFNLFYIIGDRKRLFKRRPKKENQPKEEIVTNAEAHTQENNSK